MKFKLDFQEGDIVDCTGNCAYPEAKATGGIIKEVDYRWSTNYSYRVYGFVRSDGTLYDGWCRDDQVSRHVPKASNDDFWRGLEGKVFDIIADIPAGGRYMATREIIKLVREADNVDINRATQQGYVQGKEDSRATIEALEKTIKGLEITELGLRKQLTTREEKLFSAELGLSTVDAQREEAESKLAEAERDLKDALLESKNKSMKIGHYIKAYNDERVLTAMWRDRFDMAQAELEAAKSNRDSWQKAAQAAELKLLDIQTVVNKDLTSNKA